MAVDLLHHVERESARFAEVLAGTDPATRVPSCPEWSALDLAWHLTEVHHFWAVIVRDRLTDPDPAEASTPPRPADLPAVLALYDRVTAELLDALAGADDAEAVWTWAPEQEVGFVRRFQAHEALMHRVDAELAAGALTPLPAELAADGVEVVLRYTMTWRPNWSPWQPAGGVGLLRATDTGGRWTAALGTWGGTSPATGKTYEAQPCVQLRDGGDPTFTVSAPAADLDAWLWHRPGFGEVTVDGSAEDFARLQAQVEQGVQ